LVIVEILSFRTNKINTPKYLAFFLYFILFISFILGKELRKIRV